MRKVIHKDDRNRYDILFEWYFRVGQYVRVFRLGDRFGVRADVVVLGWYLINPTGHKATVSGIPVVEYRGQSTGLFICYSHSSLPIHESADNEGATDDDKEQSHVRMRVDKSCEQILYCGEKVSDAVKDVGD
jgi:hypothetical protein